MKEKTFQSLKWRLSDRLRDAQIEGSLAVVVGVQEHPEGTASAIRVTGCSGLEAWRLGFTIHEDVSLLLENFLRRAASSDEVWVDVSPEEDGSYTVTACGLCATLADAVTLVAAMAEYAG